MSDCMHRKSPEDFLCYVACAAKTYSWRLGTQRKLIAALKDDAGSVHWACVMIQVSATDSGDTDSVWYELLHAPTLKELASTVLTNEQIGALFELTRTEAFALGVAVTPTCGQAGSSHSAP